MQKHKQSVRHNRRACVRTNAGKRKFQREQVGVAIAIYQEDFDLSHASVITAEIHWMDQASFLLIKMVHVHAKI